LHCTRHDWKYGKVSPIRPPDGVVYGGQRARHQSVLVADITRKLTSKEAVVKALKMSLPYAADPRAIPSRQVMRLDVLEQPAARRPSSGDETREGPG
jgi:hypothetical protein